MTYELKIWRSLQSILGSLGGVLSEFVVKAVVAGALLTACAPFASARQLDEGDKALRGLYVAKVYEGQSRRQLIERTILLRVALDMSARGSPANEILKAVNRQNAYFAALARKANSGEFAFPEDEERNLLRSLVKISSTAVTGSEAAAAKALVDEFLDRLLRARDMLVGPDEQIKAQYTLALQNSATNEFIEKVWQDGYDAYVADKKGWFAQTYDVFFSDAVGVVPGTIPISPNGSDAGSPTNFGVGFAVRLGSRDANGVVRPPSEREIGAVQAQLKKIGEEQAANAREIAKEIAKFVQLSNEEKARELNRIGRERYWQMRELKLQAAQSQVYLLTTLIGLKDEKLAHGISAVATAGIEIAAALQKYQKTVEVLGTASDIMKMGATVLTGDVVRSALTMASSLGLMGPSSDEVILAQIAELRTTMMAIAQSLHDHLTRIEERQIKQFQALIELLGKLQEAVDTANENIVTVQNQLLFLQNSVLMLDRNINQGFTDLFTAVKELTTGHCLSWRGSYAGDEMKPDDIRKCWSAYRGVAISTARLPTYAGVSFDPSSPGDEVADLSRPIERNVEFLYGLGRAASSGIPPLAERLPNPLMWSLAAAAYLRVALDWPDVYKRASLKDIGEIYAAGALEQQAMRSLALTQVGSKVSGRREIFANLVAAAETSAKTTSDEIEALRVKYGKQRLTSYDAWGAANQTSDFRPSITGIPACSSEKAIYGLSLELSVPGDFHKLIPNAVKTALDLKLGKASYCYGAIKFEPKTPKLDGRLSMRIFGDFTFYGSEDTQGYLTVSQRFLDISVKSRSLAELSAGLNSTTAQFAAPQLAALTTLAGVIRFHWGDATEPEVFVRSDRLKQSLRASSGDEVAKGTKVIERELGAFFAGVRVSISKEIATKLDSEATGGSSSRALTLSTLRLSSMLRFVFPREASMESTLVEILFGHIPLDKPVSVGGYVASGGDVKKFGAELADKLAGLKRWIDAKMTALDKGESYQSDPLFESTLRDIEQFITARKIECANGDRSSSVCNLTVSMPRVALPTLSDEDAQFAFANGDYGAALSISDMLANDGAPLRLTRRGVIMLSGLGSASQVDAARKTFVAGNAKGEVFAEHFLALLDGKNIDAALAELDASQTPNVEEQFYVATLKMVRAGCLRGSCDTKGPLDWYYKTARRGSVPSIDMLRSFLSKAPAPAANTLIRLYEELPGAPIGQWEYYSLLGVVATNTEVRASAYGAKLKLQSKASQGDIEAMVELASVLRKSPNQPFYLEDGRTAEHWYALAANENDARAQFALWEMFDVGETVNLSDKEARAWLEKSVKSNYLPAQLVLAGQQFAAGDNDGGRSMLISCAESGLASAQIELGDRLTKGDGVARSLVEAAYWYARAQASGEKNATAKYQLIEPQLADAEKVQLKKRLGG